EYNTIDVMYLPQFTLATTKTTCSGDSTFFLEDAVITPAKNALPYDWKIIGMPSKSIAQLMSLTVGGNTGTHLVTHLDSIAVGNYKIQACTADSTLGCRACDTTTIIAKPQIRFQYTGDSLFCPNDAPQRLRDNIKLSSGELNDTLYNISLLSFNGNTNPPSNIQRIFEKNGSIFTPRVAVGKAIFAIESPKYCYADGSIGLRVQDTLAISYTVSPDTVVRLPRTSFTFSANTNSPSVWWYFGTGNKADTSQLDPITWSFDSKIADYKVSVRSFHNNGCYGEYTRIVSIWDVSGLAKFERESKITQDLRMISSDWQFDQLQIFDTQGKLVYQTNLNTGAPQLGLSAGIYTYKITAHNGQNQVEKSGKWLNYGE
ncbi:MAG: T9SS type A sorting domain-containing protein, partial [Bacteroidota bacterium]